MYYPDYPNNRLVVNGTDISETYHVILADGYSLGLPSLKTYTVDIPGSNGVLDLTETLLGDTAYGNRDQEFTFYIINPTNIEQLKSQLINFLHGKAYDYTMSMDPEYTYHGRFTITNCNHAMVSSGKIWIVTVSVDADPYKRKAPRLLLINAVGGNETEFPSGRRRVQPAIQTTVPLIVIYDHKKVVLQAGTWTIDDLLFTYGTNNLYLNSYPVHNLTWGDLVTDGVTWGEFGGTALYEWYKSKGNTNIVSRLWSDYSNESWDELSVSAWNELTYRTDIPNDIDDVRVQYDWEDL